MFNRPTNGLGYLRKTESGSLILVAPSRKIISAVAASVYLTLPPPVGASPYSTQADAQAAINNQVSGCVGFVELDPAGILSSFSAVTSPTSTGMTIIGNPDAGPSCQATAWFGATLAGGTVVTLNAFAGGGVIANSIELYDDAGTLMDSDSGVTTPVSVTVPSGGVYEVKLRGTSAAPGFGGGTDLFVFNTSGSLAMALSGVRAAYGMPPSYIYC